VKESICGIIINPHPLWVFLDFTIKMELNKIYCMDCLEGLKKIPDNSVDLIVTDPPYNTGMTAENITRKDTTNTRFYSKKSPIWLGNFFHDSYTDEEYIDLVRNCCIQLFRVLKENKAGYVYINWKMLGKWLDELKSSGFIVKNVIIWDKLVHGLNYQNYAYKYEMIIYFVKGRFQLNNKRPQDMNNYFYSDIWRIQRDLGKQDNIYSHETVKQIKVVRLPIEHASREGDLICDPFMGSGTTAVACKQLNRNFIGFEISQEYCDIANKRLSQGNLKEWVK